MEKLTFGQFLAQRRNEKSLTQKELAEKLYVCESAVSKWEKDRRKPDIDLVSKLSEILGVTETELIRASVDKSKAIEKSQARKFRIINNTYNLLLVIGFSIALLVCFIVNLAVSHNLSWFFIVLTAIVLSAIILLLPQYIKKYKLLIIPLSWVLGLFLLLGVISFYTGGDWFFVPTCAIILAYLMIFSPLIIAKYLPKFKKHNAIISISVCTLFLQILFIVINIYTWNNDYSSFGWCFSKAAPISLFWYAVLISTAIIINYTKINSLLKTTAVCYLWLLMYNLFTYGFLILFGISPNANFWEADLFKWSSADLISANVVLLVNLAIFLVASIIAVLGFIQHSKSRKEHKK